MGIKCGEYKHFKGNEYIVYGVVKTLSNEKLVLYKQNYSPYNFWVRPLKMFTDKVSYNGKDNIHRFICTKKINATHQINQLIELLKTKNIIITHTETLEKYTIFSLTAETHEIMISPTETYSSYLTDTQLAFRMGYDLYTINGNIVITNTCLDLPNKKKLEIILPNEPDTDYQTKKILSKHLNACSIDLRISDEFFKPKHRKIDMTTTMYYSVSATNLWKKLTLHEINGSKGIILLPNQMIVTHTLERIVLPSDCAGKIEIKSTYARLGLSVTSSDFCNPGWKGKFPLTIKNNGHHILFLHPNEVMLQLSLIPTGSPIVNEYHKKGVFMDDDGTPFRFWRSQTIKQFSSEADKKRIMAFYQNVVTEIRKKSEDAENEEDRFQDTFLRYYEAKIKKDKYKNINDAEKRLHTIWKKYKDKERTLKFFFCKPVKFSTFIFTLLPALIPTILDLYANKTFSTDLIIKCIISLVVAIIIEIVLFFKTPKYYCTFEKLNFSELYKK